MVLVWNAITVEVPLDVAKKKYLGVQNGELLETYSDVKLLKNLIGSCPNTSIEKGVMEEESRNIIVNFGKV